MNSKEQFGQLVMKYKDSLFFTAKSILRNDTDAEDAVCSAIMKAFENFSQLREQQYFKSWITRIVINEAYAICRKNKNLQSMEEMTTEPAYSDYHDEMWEIVNIMFYYNDIPINEIAEYLDIAPGTVKSRLNRGRKKLKELITL